MVYTSFVALGSNIEPKVQHLKQAIQWIGEIQHTKVISQSLVYETVPKGYDNQDDFLNMVVKVETNLRSQDFLHQLQAIEQKLKRVRTIKNGPRTIDLDILTFNEALIETEELTVPHPRLHERAFVLFPFTDVGAEEWIPSLNQNVKTLRDQLPSAEKEDVQIAGQLNEM